MKIIHTADWHLGKVLYKQELNEEISLFLQWLKAFIIEEDVDALLISGDVFDLANPSHKDLTLYYNFLHTIADTRVQVIITGGNHDSVSLLETTQALLTPMRIHVVGGMPASIEQVVLPLYTKDGALCCVVIAIPFLRDRDLRKAESADIQTDQTDAFPAAVMGHYARALDYAKQTYGQATPMIAMGHLFTQGAITSDSEREIHVGHLQGLDSRLFPPGIDYMALGHIHKPQRVGGNDHIRYSGSPVYLDFSEAGYEKQLLLLTLPEEGGPIQVEKKPIPCFRKLVTWKGSLAEIKKSIADFTNPYPLQALADIQVVEPSFDLAAIAEMEALTQQADARVKIIRNRIEFTEKASADSLLIEDTLIQELHPMQVFEKKLENGFTEENRDVLLQVYATILEEVYQQNSL